jgi:hypothetical protein
MKGSRQAKTKRTGQSGVAYAAWALVVCCVSMTSLGQTANSVTGSLGQARPERRAIRRAVTVADCIQMTGLGDPYYVDGGRADGIVAKFSPNGKHFVVLVRKGNLQNNTNEYSLLLFKTADVFHSPAPQRLISMSSSSNQPAIHNVVWLNDNDSILFLGEHPGETSQLYSLRVSSKQLKKLTHRTTNVTSFAATASGQEIVYVTEKAASSLINANVLRNGFIVTNEWLSDVISGRYGGGDDDEHRLYIRRAGKRQETQIRLVGHVIDSDELAMALSPNGSYLLIQTTSTHIPESWGKYEDQSLQTVTRHLPRGTRTNVGQYELVDTRTGESTLLSGTPIPSLMSEMAWSPDGNSVVVSDVYLPLDIDNFTEQRLRRSHAFLVEYKIPSRQFQTVSAQDLRLLKWDAKTNTVVCDVGRIASINGKSTPKVYFRKNGGTWSQVDAPEVAKTASQLDIVLDENMNAPPRIMSIAPGDGRKSVLMDLNPQFRDLAFAKVEEVSWKSSLGEELSGGLYWPVDYVAGRKYPLVIQTHGWISNRFWMNGPVATGFAAQPLAGKGFFVLQLGETAAWHLTQTAKEVPSAVAAYESAIDYLDGRGLIDRNLVAIIGFSRTCYYVTHMLAFSKYHITAAVIADGVDGDYFQYFAFSNAEPLFGLEFEKMNGGAPFGDALSSWVERVSAFHMDRVQAPVRIQAIGTKSLLLEWNWFSGLLVLGKSVDMVYLPDGTHRLKKPWELMISQQGDVDWFCFWLKGEEDPDPTKAAQYKRWRELRKLQQANNAGQRPN